MMETHKGKSVPVVNEFQVQSTWVPVTPVKPNVSRLNPSPIYDNNHGGLHSQMWGKPEDFVSGYAHQNHAQHLLSYLSSADSSHQTTSNHIWEEVHGTPSDIHLQRGNDSIFQRRSLEADSPHWNSQGRRSVAGAADTTGPGSSSYPSFASWETSRMPWTDSRAREIANLLESNPAAEPMGDYTFGAILNMGDSPRLEDNGGNASTYGTSIPEWLSQSQVGGLANGTTFSNRDALYALHKQNSGMFLQEEKNGTLSQQCWRDGNVYSPPSAKHAGGMCSTFAPPTPDSRQRIESNTVAWNSVCGTNGRPDEQNLLPEHEVAAAMINLNSHHDERVPGPITDSTQGQVSKEIEETHNPINGGNNGIDLNKTPQKKTRKRRYQPKVVRENKLKSTPKPATPKPTESNSKDTKGKRKYVRKNKIKTQSTISPEEATETVDPKQTKPAAKSCRKSLNFDLNGQLAEGSSFHNSNGCLEVEPKANESLNGDKLKQPEYFSHTELTMKVSTLDTAYDINCNEKQQLRDYMSLPQKENLDSSLPDMNIVPSHKEGTSTLCQNEADISCRTDFYWTQSHNSSPCAGSNDDMQTRGSKRSSSYIADITDATAATVDANQSIIWQHESTEKLPPGFIPEACKKKRTEKVQRAHTRSTSSSAAASEDLSRVASSPHHLEVYLNGSKYSQCNPIPFRDSAVTNDQAKVFLGSSATENLLSTWADLNRLKKRRSKSTTRARNPAALAEIASPSKGFHSQMADTKNEPYPHTATSIGVQSCTETLVIDTKATPRSKMTSTKQDIVQQNLELVVYGSNQSTRKAAGSASSRRPATVDKITQLLKRLDINAKDRKSRKVRKIPCREQNMIVPFRANKHEHNALVPYKRDGTIVPFDGPFYPTSKRRQRAKVDLDDETTRVWRLLLENIDNQGIDGTDEDKAKWWEDERQVFRGRVDSFIARMRLVQGDRRFTPWKGSVLDSVIGVFLTQNVSDHLSSSAFMSMAARFPFKTQSNRDSMSEEATSALIVEPDLYSIEAEESITWNEKTTDQQTLDRNSTVTQCTDHREQKEVVSLIRKASPNSHAEYFAETCEKIPNKARTRNSHTTGTDTGSIPRDDATSPQQSVISSQNSMNSPNLSAVGTLLESTPRTQATSSLYGFSFMEMLKAAENPLLSESYRQMHHQLEGTRHVTEFSPEMTGVSSSNYQFDLKSGFHLHDTKGIEIVEVESRSYMSRKDENSPATEQSNLSTETTDQQKSPDSISGAPPNMCSYYVLEGETMIMQSVEEPLDTIVSAHEEMNSMHKGIQSSNCFQKTEEIIGSTQVSERTKNNSKDVEQIPEVNYATGGSDTVNANPSNLGKGKAGKGKKNEYDWDSLRREAQANGKKRERTANTRDSLDWEAVRQADVKVIADTIKERGMNNVLAERIKDLLDRLVRDHGSIDLEWLRDIPPDKAKEYLLSFRGLGLKSVECVRLLTLHHLAFPVDTNVGRIAVRLGWVPLQPLPESLQLHLLELYPILESIQKYLWPRLCKLDQKTLYELHYHMITFGKVFCTKRQPNCNACPLRGECRHFASAFASARFCLPGPEERSIIPSNGSTTANVKSQASTNLLPSPASWNNDSSHSDSQFNYTRRMHVSCSPLQLQLPQTIHLERKSINSICEPIVEVPASPEPETQQEQVLCDIEDSFYEDPDEIPTIQLNMKEFTQTLQNFMQANSELQEAGMSNELVALTPEAASIPTPKLKNINHLRTEHHVYELPDTHPLLQELDRREPDDPCSYLLAIWTPGETANSIEPPARRCISDDPRILCNEETCSYCSSQREANTQTVRGTLLIPCRTAMRGSFPLNGTYFQVNEVFADHDSSLNPIAVPRSWLWNLPRRTVYFGTSIPTIFKGLNTEDIQHCFWRGYVCVRGFDQKKRAPRPLMARLHFPASRMPRGAKGKAAYDE